MKKIIIISLFSLSCIAAKVGWKDNVFTANQVIQNGISSVIATSDDFQIEPGNSAIINVDSDNASSALRSIVIMQGKAIGQRIRVTCRPAGGNSQIDDDAAIPGGGNIRLVNNWVCNQDGNSINLYWNGTDWEEDGRVNL